jgi:hypothetical protein
MKDLNDAEKAVLTHASVALEKATDKSVKNLRKLVESFAAVTKLTQPSLEVDVNEVTARLQHAASVWIDPPKVLTNHRVKPWWRERKPALDPMRFWLRYRRYLLQEKELRARDLDGIDDQTDEIIDCIENPTKPGAWDVRGMVVGSVQSGKTANYVGLISKALDAGYKLIVVMAGIHNNLRAQTQERIDEGIVGYDSQRRPVPGNPECKVGVGRIIIPEIGTPPGITPLTNSKDNGDFTTRSQTTNYSLSGGPVILVVKKNVTPLKHILEWTQVQAGQLGVDGAGGKIANVPLLLIDDEADNASINTKDKPGLDNDELSITRINKLIRLILNRFQQSAYIGYTATPFANIFINPDAERDDEGQDLFPRDFIVNVRPSNRYVGAAKVFGYSGDPDAGIEAVTALPIINTVDDHEDAFPPGHKKEHVPAELPPSLTEAVLCFVLTCAARRARGQKLVHNSMLVHVTHLVAVQEVVRELLFDEFCRIKGAIVYDSATNPICERLKALWEGSYSETSRAVRVVENDERLNQLSWQQVQAELRPAVERIEVKVIHGKSKELLNYSARPEGVSVIAVGGNKLSRGLTLEGLSISYFLRATRMYDTLMQMGRWFGYRDGYLDLCRLFTTPESQSWFSFIALAEVELKREFDEMVRRDLTPTDYGLRVRQHPDGMVVTALNKMAHGQTREVTFAGQLVQTAFFERDVCLQTRSATLVEGWLRSLPEFRVCKGTLRWTASRGSVVALLEQMQRERLIHGNCSRFGPELLDFIGAQAEAGGLEEWCIVMPMGKERTMRIADNDVRLVWRRDAARDGGKPYSLPQANVQDPKHEMADLEEITLTDQIADEALAKMEVREAGATATPMIALGAEAEAVRACVGKPVSEAVLVLGTLRGKESIGSMREIMRILRPASKGLLLIYPLDTTEIAGLESASFVPAFAMSFPATHRARRLQYKVNPTWIAKQMERFGPEDIDDDDSDE